MLDIKIPNLGDGVKEAVVLSVSVDVGETISVGQMVLELETDKAVAPVLSTCSGTVKEILVKEGDTVSSDLLYMRVVSSAGVSDANVLDQSSKESDLLEVKKEKVPSSVAAPLDSSNLVASSEYSYCYGCDDNIPAAPYLKKMAREMQLDLNLVQPTGRSGRVTSKDVQVFISGLISFFLNHKKGLSNSAQSNDSAVTIPEVLLPLEQDFSIWGDTHVEKASTIRKKISKKMREAWYLPHVTQFADVDITDLMALRKKYNPSYKEQGGNLTLTVFALKAIVVALKKFPMFNASFDEAKSDLIYKNYYHIGVAVDTDSGLMVPVIRDVDKKDLLTLSLELSSLAQKARDRRISLEDLKGGTFTLSNLGGLGAGAFTPIINTPEVAILGMGRGSQVPSYCDRDGEVVLEPRLKMPLGLSYDHRVVDGADGARFVACFIEAIQSLSEDDIRIEG